MARKVYLDWLRGLAVMVMVEAHVVDAWTREADRHDRWYADAQFVAGLAAPLFLFMAGLTLTMSAARREAREGRAKAAAHICRWGWQIFALALLFRLQAQLLGWGAWANLLKVDILNVMGLAMVGAGVLYALGRSRGKRVLIFTLATVAVVMSTPLVRQAPWLAALPDPIENYLRPMPGKTTFALFPWAAFLLAGGVAGELVAAAQSAARERRLQLGLLVAGLAGIGLGYAASFRPSIYATADFWTSSPTFFFIRLGILAALVPMAWSIEQTTKGSSTSFLSLMGRSSFFVYWIHVEMVYGFLGRLFRRELPLVGSLAATVALCLVLYVIVLWKNRLMEGATLRGPLRIFAPVLR